MITETFTSHDTQDPPVTKRLKLENKVCKRECIAEANSRVTEVPLYIRSSHPSSRTPVFQLGLLHCIMWPWHGSQNMISRGSGHASDII